MRKNLVTIVFIILLLGGLASAKWCPWASPGKRAIDAICPCCPDAQRRNKTPDTAPPGKCNCQKGIIPSGCHANCPCRGQCDHCKHCGCKRK